MARSKVSRAGFDAISEALVILSVVVFFAVALAIGLGGNALSGVRDRLGVRPQAIAGVSVVATITVSPTPTTLGTAPLAVTAFQVATPVPVLATVDAILTAHADLAQASALPLTTPAASLEPSASPTEAQPSPTEAQPSPTETILALTLLSTPTMTIALPSQTPTQLVPSTPTNAPATSTSIATPTPALAVSTPTIASTRNPATVVSNPTGPATTTPLPPAASTATSAPASTSTYAPPVLIGSSPGSGTTVLSWSEATPLGANDFFDVRVWQDGQPAHGIANVQQASFVIGGNFPAGTYNWTIAIIHKQGGQIVTLVQAPTTLRFSWAPAGSGSSGGGPPTR